MFTPSAAPAFISAPKARPFTSSVHRRSTLQVDGRFIEFLYNRADQWGSM
jgi:hypothetical protein